MSLLPCWGAQLEVPRSDYTACGQPTPTSIALARRRKLGRKRNKLSEEVICALLPDFRQHGQKAVAQVCRT
jgi:hypothetical protein